MQRTVIALLVLLGLAVAPLAAQAEEVVHEEAGVEIWYPDEWDAEIDGDVMTLTDDEDDPDIMLQFIMLEDEDEVDEALDGIDEALGELVDDLELDEGEELDVNGMEGVIFGGTGRVEGEDVLVGLLLVDTPGGHVMAVLALATEDLYELFEDDVDKIFRRMKPVD